MLSQFQCFRFWVCTSTHTDWNPSSTYSVTFFFFVAWHWMVQCWSAVKFGCTENYVKNSDKLILQLFKEGVGGGGHAGPILHRSMDWNHPLLPTDVHKAFWAKTRKQLSNSRKKTRNGRALYLEWRSMTEFETALLVRGRTDGTNNRNSERSKKNWNITKMNWERT